jgi:hypothetical protein
MPLEPIEDCKLALNKLLGKSHPGIAYNRHFDAEEQYLVEARRLSLKLGACWPII